MSTRNLGSTHFLRLIVASIITALVLAALATSANAKAGLPDPTFAGIGKLQTIFRSNLDEATDVLVQPDGKIVAGGTAVGSGQEVFALARYNVDGSLDSSFGTGGKVELDPGYSAHSTFGDAVALQPDGKILIAGSSEYGGDFDFVVARVHPNGVKDDTFGDVGFKRYSFGLGGTLNDFANDIAIQPNGQIVVAGSAAIASGSNLAILRLTEGGSITSGFPGGTTAINFPIGSTYDAAQSVALQTDGRIVVAGDTYNGTDYDLAMARVTSAGVLDSSFDGDGKFDLAVGSDGDGAEDLSIQPDGKLVVAGYAELAGTYRGIVMRFNPNGTNDAGFGSAGLAVPAGGTDNDSFSALALLASGKIVAAGSWSPDPSAVSTVAGPYIARLNPNGSLDPSFGTNGSTLSPTTPVGTVWNAIAVAPDGKIAAAGEDGNALNNGPGGTFSIGRYTADDPPIAPIALGSTIAKSLKGKIKSSKLKKFSGTATGTGIAKVQIALGRTDTKLLKKKKRCLFMTGSSGKTKSYKAKKKKCTTPSKWLSAKGTANWNYKLTRKLKPGKYTLYVRALNAAGVPQSKLTRRSFQIVK